MATLSPLVPRRRSLPKNTRLRKIIKRAERTDLRYLLKNSEIADIFDSKVRQRVGEMIGRLGFDPSTRKW